MKLFYDMKCIFTNVYLEIGTYYIINMYPLKAFSLLKLPLSRSLIREALSPARFGAAQIR